MKIAGIAGGVGTTVAALILEAIDGGLDLTDADIVLARNDYRCGRALVERDVPREAVIFLLVDPERPLTRADFESIIGRPVWTLELSPAVARADDAGLLGPEVANRSVVRYRGQLLAAASKVSA